LLIGNIVVNMLLHLYAVNAEPEAYIKFDPEDGRSRLNGHLTNGHADARARDAEEFELHGLTSDDEDAGDDEPLVPKETQRAV
jgi:hypothetical protein